MVANTDMKVLPSESTIWNAVIANPSKFPSLYERKRAYTMKAKQILDRKININNINSPD